MNKSGVFHARLIHLANGDTLTDKDFTLIDGFVVVAADNEAQLPTWYNQSEVVALQEVEVPQKSQQTRQQNFVRFL